MSRHCQQVAAHPSAFCEEHAVIKITQSGGEGPKTSVAPDVSIDDPTVLSLARILHEAIDAASSVSDPDLVVECASSIRRSVAMVENYID